WAKRQWGIHRAKSSSNWWRVGAAVERSLRSWWAKPPAQSGKSGVIMDSAYTVLLTTMLAFSHACAQKEPRPAAAIPALAAETLSHRLDCLRQPGRTRPTWPRRTPLSVVSAGWTQNGHRGLKR